jgi:hypothetical protein
MHGRSALVLACAVSLAACSSSEDRASGTGTCDQIAAYQGCTRYENLSPQLAADLQTFCVEQGQGTWSDTPCPTTGRTGVCSWVQMGVTIHDSYYDPTTADWDAADCVQGGGTWTPG